MSVHVSHEFLTGTIYPVPDRPLRRNSAFGFCASCRHDASSSFLVAQMKMLDYQMLPPRKMGRLSWQHGQPQMDSTP
jgi:hypothetical protein